jgi:hypothetical protein
VEETTMRRFLATAAAAAVLGAGALVPTDAQAMGPASVRSALERVDATERVARECREVCNGDVCRRRCFNRPDHNEGHVERRVYRDRYYRDSDERWRYRDVDRGPGVRFRLGFD